MSRCLLFAAVLWVAVGCSPTRETARAPEELSAPDPIEDRVAAFMEERGGTVTRGRRPGKPVVVVDLGHKNVTDADLRELAPLKGLETLNLDFTQVTDAGMKELAGLKSLHTLSLDSTQVTD